MRDRLDERSHQRCRLADPIGKRCAIKLDALARITDSGHRLARFRAIDTPVLVLAPGTGKTKTGRLWVFLRDERPYGGEAPPAVVYRYSPD